ncbi:MAG: AraC family transcriptional regulator [Flavobacterium sp.]|uniref:AraC family transcriptional regulator n=1 Tax=Flavobacterium sp. TaxID=239 RepID=UPI003265E6A4
MVCHRCLLAVETVLNDLSIPFQNVTIGEIHLSQEISSTQIELLSDNLMTIGLELLDNRRSGMMEKIKQLVIKKARNEVNPADNKKALSLFLSDNLFHEYTYLSSLFSSIEGRTIENYYIEQRIEKVKELLVYGEMNLSEIAFEMEYSSLAHLSNQFKKVTGLTPTHFLKVGSQKRKLLDKI